jgi:hypothetical protein
VYKSKQTKTFSVLLIDAHGCKTRGGGSSDFFSKPQGGRDNSFLAKLLGAPYFQFLCNTPSPPPGPPCASTILLPVEFTFEHRSRNSNDHQSKRQFLAKAKNLFWLLLFFRLYGIEQSTKKMERFSVHNKSVKTKRNFSLKNEIRLTL